MHYYVWFSTSQYDPETLTEFDNQEEVLSFLNKYASNPEFDFTVVYGRRVSAEPVSTVTQYRLT